MRAGSLFSGVGGLDLGMHRAGVDIVFQCEQDAYRREVLARHWPGVPCFEDVRDVGVAGVRQRQVDRQGRGPLAEVEGRPPAADGVDLLFGGFPCQDLSVAGRRAGLEAGERSSLFFEFARIADALLGDRGWLLVENVPGLLSSHGGRDFAVLLATLAELGFHDLAWRVLDSRHFGVPQRRRRVFILARRARGARAREVLLEPEGGGGDFETGREARTRVAASLSRGSSSAGVSAPGRRQEDDENIVGTLGTGPAAGGHRIGADEAAAGQLVVNALDRKGGGADDNDAQAGHLVAHTLRSEGFDASEDGTGRGTPLVARTVRSHQRPGSNSFDLIGSPTDADGVRAPSGLSGRLDRCAVDPRPDGRRYAACGDAVTVNVAYWIGRRLMANETSHLDQSLKEGVGS